MKAHSYAVHCRLFYKTETVYVHTIDLGNTHAAIFSGCNSSFHDCSECRLCEGITLALFEKEFPEQYTI